MSYLFRVMLYKGIPIESPSPDEMPGSEFNIERALNQVDQLISGMKDYFYTIWEYLKPQKQLEVQRAFKEINDLTTNNIRSRRQVDEIIFKVRKLIDNLNQYIPFEILDRWDSQLIHIRRGLWEPTIRQRYVGAYAHYRSRH